MIDKDSLPLDKPRRTPDHPTKSHVVKTRVDGKEKIIRFGEQGASTAGKPKQGESERMTAKRASFKSRHAKNIAKGKSSAAYWANKVKWAKGGSVELEDLNSKYEGIKKPDFSLLDSFKGMIKTLQSRAEETQGQEFDPLETLKPTSAAPTLEDLYSSYAAEPAAGPAGIAGIAGHAGRAEAGVTPSDALSLAASQMGLSEGGQRAAIQDYLTTGGANLDPATTAWCAAFVNSTLQQTGVQGTGSNMARSFLDWGQSVDQPQEGDLAVFSRGDPSGPYGHVGFFKGYDDQGNVLVLGGNQGDAVSISPYPRESLLGFRRAGEAEPQKFAEGGEVPKPERGEPETSSLTGFPEIDRMIVALGNVNQMFNPIEAIGDSMDASKRMLAPETEGWDRVAALGDMLSGVGGVVAPVATAARAGTPAAAALMESLLGGSPATTAMGDTAKDIGRTIIERANQRGPVPVMGSNFGNVLGDADEGRLLYHAGTYTPGEPIKRPLFTSADRDFAESYVDPNRIEGSQLTAFRAAPKSTAYEDEIMRMASKYLPDFEEMGYAPASAFDENLFDPSDISRMISDLRGRGYDSAEISDVAMSGNKEGKALVLFPDGEYGIKPVTSGIEAADRIANIADEENNLAQWYGPSNSNSYPQYKGKIWYHVTDSDQFKLRDSDPLWMSEDPDFSGHTSSRQNHSFPIHTNVRNPFYGSDSQIAELSNRVKLSDEEIYKLKNPENTDHAGTYRIIERPDVFQAIQDMGYDAAELYENNTKNLVVFKPQGSVKSISKTALSPFDPWHQEWPSKYPNDFNIGTFDPNDPDITKAHGGLITKAEGGTVNANFNRDRQRDDLRTIGDTVYERRADGVLSPLSRVKYAASKPAEPDTGSRTGFPEVDRMLVTLGNLNEALNPMVAIQNSQKASRRMFEPNLSGWDRMAAAGDMLSNVAGVVAPAALSARAGVPATTALMESLVGGSSLPDPRNEAEAIARDILEMRATGNVDAVTEAMMNAADPQYMYNYTPLPMDQASRMERASDIGFPKDDWYHGTNQDIHGFQGNTYTADNPTVASTYARGITDAQTYPLRLRSKLSTTPVDAGGRLWSQIPIEAIDDPAVASWLDPSVLQKTRTIEPAAVKEGRSGVRFKDVLDIGPGFDSEQFKRAGYPPEVAESMRQDYLRKLDKPATIDVRLAPNQIRSRFARFDPMFAHLRNLSAGVAAGAVGLEAAQYDPDQVDTIADTVRKREFATGGAVKYDPAAVDNIINQIREVNRG